MRILVNRGAGFTGPRCVRAVVTGTRNNHGPYQFPENLIPPFVTNLLCGQLVPLYGDAKENLSWWLSAKGRPGPGAAAGCQAAAPTGGLTTSP
jgi:hypothetical protein